VIPLPVSMLTGCRKDWRSEFRLRKLVNLESRSFQRKNGQVQLASGTR